MGEQKIKHSIYARNALPAITGQYHQCQYNCTRRDYIAQLREMKRPELEYQGMA